MDYFNKSLQDAVTIFLGIIVQATPFILLGVFVSAILAHFIKEEKLLKIIPKNRFLALLGACFIGFLFPVCECGNVPVARRLIWKGVKPSVAITFLLAAPVMNPIVILATWSAFKMSPELVILRVVFTFIIAFTIGLIMSFHPKEQDMLSASAQHKEHTYDDEHFTAYGKASGFFAFFKTVSNEFLEMMKILIFGAFIASFLQVVIPRDIILSMGRGPILSILAMIAFAFIISVCANVDAFIALSYSNTFTTGALLAFLTFGPMIDLKGIFMLRSTFKDRIILLITLLALFLTIFLTYLVNFFYG